MQNHPQSCRSSSGWMSTQAAKLVAWSNLDPMVLPFAGVAESAQSLAICINWRSTSPAHRYSCYGQVMDTWQVIL